MEATDRSVIGSAQQASVAANERKAVHASALAGLEAADSKAVFAAYESAVKDRADLEEALLRTCTLLSNKPTELLLESPIRAIRDIALAAIQLARDVALKE